MVYFVINKLINNQFRGKASIFSEVDTFSIAFFGKVFVDIVYWEIFVTRLDASLAKQTLGILAYEFFQVESNFLNVALWADANHVFLLKYLVLANLAFWVDILFEEI